MRRAGRAATLLVAAALVPGCASTKPLPVPVLGRTVTVVTDPLNTRLKGELVAVEEARLWLRAEDGVREVPLGSVREVRVKRHSFGARKAGIWAAIGGVVTGGGLAAACSSVEGSDNCGALALIVGGLWALTGALAAPALESSSRIVYPRPTADTLRPYARLPQGLPAGVIPATLAGVPRRPDGEVK